jgi:serine/threonine protein kinase
MLLAEHCHNSTIVARFLTEARTAAALEHANIVKVYQIGECAHGHYFVMEYVDGSPLETVLQRNPLPVKTAVALQILVTDAVQYAHSKGVIHRDLKPGNIMLDRTRRPVVMDFGIAKFLGQSSSLTQQGAIMGTPGYMPPEQAGEDPTQIGPHSDVYSLGAILYSMLSGRPPFEEATALKTLLKVVSAEPPPPIHQFRADVPRELEAICLKCLNKRPADRYPSAQALADDLRRFRAGWRSGLGDSPASTRKAGKPVDTVRKKKASKTSNASAAAFLVEQTTGKKLPVAYGTAIIGRASDCDLVVRATDVSKRHCRITFDPARGMQVEDLQSINGISVNGRPVIRAVLKEGDELGVAGHRFRVVWAK